MTQDLEQNKKSAIEFYRFRFDDAGKIVEHRDSIQKIPAETKCGRPMY